MPRLTSEQRRQISTLVECYSKHRSTLATFLVALEGQIRASDSLQNVVHSIKSRTKDPLHLKDKLERKYIAAISANKAFGVTERNLLMKINDLAGIRLIHLHTQQTQQIVNGLQEIFSFEQFNVVEGPAARTWDDESRSYFRSIGIKTVASPSLYTSIHYVIRPNKKVPFTCEIQVRTLMEEVWGEVNHSINYPHASKSVPCREQIAALARSTSACSRLVDAIFRSHDVHVG